MAAPLAPMPGYKGLLAAQSGGSGQLVGQAFAPWQGVAGGAFATPEEARLSRELNAVAVRKRKQQQRGALTPSVSRVAVAGALSVSTPAARA